MRYRLVNVPRLGQAVGPAPTPPAPVPAPVAPAPPGTKPQWVNDSSQNVTTTLIGVGLVAALAIGALTLFK